MSPPRPRPPDPAVPGWVRSAGPSHRKPAASGAGARRAFGATWWGRAWVDALEGRARLDPNRLPRGRGYARSGAVEEIDVGAGVVRAAVQGSRRAPYAVTVRVRTFEPAEWERVFDAMAAQVGHTAALLDGELPPEVAADVAGAGLDLLPGPGELQPRCSCPDWADPCKHAAAVCYLVADALDADPFALLLLRGRGRDEVLAALRSRRGVPRPAGRAEPAGGAGDPGTPARAAFAAYRAHPPAGLPAPPLPPPQPGRPAVLATDPPPDSGLSAAALAGLAADAAARAHAMLVDPDPAGAAALDLGYDADLARRAASLLGGDRDGGGRTPDLALSELASRAGLPAAELTRRALAWRSGGVTGLAVLTGTWQPDTEALADGQAALGGGARRRDNRLTRGGIQLRLGRDGRWYPYLRRGRSWDPAGVADADPAAALAAALRRT